MRILKTLCVLSLSLTLFLGCTGKKKQDTSPNITEGQTNYHKITANGYGESKEKAIEDAKNDALRQFGFNISSNNGNPELVYAGKIIAFEVIKDYSEELKNGMWWEIKIEADIEKL